MRRSNSIAHEKANHRSAVLLLVCFSLLGAYALASDITVTVVGDRRWSDCTNSGGTPYGDGENYGGCSYSSYAGNVGTIGSSGDPYVGGGAGGGSEPPPDLTEQDISDKLQCALDNYLHANVKLTGGKTMKRVQAWGFGKLVNNAWVWGARSWNIDPGEDWIAIGGRAGAGQPYGRLYNGAFLANSFINIKGSRPGELDKVLTGAFTAFEMSLLFSGHEASHLIGSQLPTSDEREAEAEWYGIDAVLKFKSDGGAQCPD